MRILHVISQYPGKTGSGVYLNSMIREADKKGYRQALLGASNGEDYRNPYIKDENHFIVKFKSKNLNFPIIGMSDEMPYESSRYSQVSEEDLQAWKKEFTFYIRKAIENFKPDIILSHHLWILTSLLAHIVEDLNLDIKILAFSHGTDLRQFRSLEKYRSYVGSGIKKIDWIFSLSPSQKEEIARLYKVDKSKIKVIGGGYNGDIFYYPEKLKDYKDEIRIIYAGKISKEKGLLPAIEAFELINEKYPRAKLLLAGSGSGKDYKDILARIEKSSAPIELLGNLDQETLADYFRKSHIFFMPSYYEGLSLVTIEALASGLLVSSNFIEGLYELLGEEINKSSIINYVKEAELEENGLPSREEEGLYARRLAKSLDKQIKNLENRKELLKTVSGYIKGLSWTSIYDLVDKAIIN